MDPEGRPRGREGDQRGALTAAGDLYLPASHESSRVFKVTRSSQRSVWLLMSNLLNRSLLNRFYIFDSLFSEISTLNKCETTGNHRVPTFVRVTPPNILKETWIRCRASAHGSPLYQLS